MERAFADGAFIDVKEFPQEKFSDAMWIVTTQAANLDTPIIIVMRGFTIFLIRIGVTFGATDCQVEVPEINFFGGIEIFYGGAQRSCLFVFLIRDEYLMAGGANIGSRKPAMGPAQYAKGK